MKAWLIQSGGNVDGAVHYTAMTAETTSAQNDDLDTSSEEAELNHSDTSDENDATDVSELLAVGDPVYFNYSGITPTSAPTSLKVSVLAILSLSHRHTHTHTHTP